MPLNALTSAPSFMLNYYKYVTGDPDAVPNNPMFWENILTFYNVASVGTQILCGPTVLTPCMRKLSLTTRFVGAILLMMVEVLVVVVLPSGRVSQNGAIVAFFVVTIAAGAGKSYLEATSYATVGTMPPKFMSAVMFGCGFSGVICSVLQCIVKGSMPDTYEKNKEQAYIYFSLTLGIMAITLVMAICLRYNSFAQKYVGEFRQVARHAEHGDTESTTEESLGHKIEPIGVEEPTNTGEALDGDIVLEDQQSAAPREKFLDEEEEMNEVRVVETPEEGESVDEQKNMTTSEQLQHTRLLPVIKLIWPTMLACFCVFFLSLLIFPSLIIPVDRKSAWFSTIAILLYNCGDATGRLSTSIRKIWPTRKVILIVSFCRFAFLPLIFLCIYGYIPGHAPPFVFMALIGLTNGFFGAMTMVLGPNTPGLRTEGQHVMAGQLMGISLLAGGSVSALLALLLVVCLHL
ncbi:solute carrier family 29 (equilibrative nucleoside transporter), member 1/2/3 [Angomonas deanei]|nr:solute carrier family 29 (equilibrative nucleoside transporter), member 1/2/3 [Angomonas deanei]|eukprot:EPY33052.1 solute carrier family 29 (equilibrative nucleoside transporter), member 1/2/3 [Angomonas deanei]